MGTQAKQIETLMKIRQISQADLANRSGMHRANLCRYLAGETDIRTTSLVSLLSALDVSFDDLLNQKIQKLNSQMAPSTPLTLGDAVEILIGHLDSITAKTLLKTLVLRSEGLAKNGHVEEALKKVKAHLQEAK